jgi:hypothetical protein
MNPTDHLSLAETQVALGLKAPSAVQRRITTGLRLPSGQYIRLESFRFGARRYVSREALENFVREYAAAFDVKDTVCEKLSQNPISATAAVISETQVAAKIDDRTC